MPPTMKNEKHHLPIDKTQHSDRYRDRLPFCFRE